MKVQKKGKSKKHSPVTLKMIAERVGLTKGTCSAVLNKSVASRSGFVLQVVPTAVSARKLGRKISAFSHSPALAGSAPV